MKKTKIIAIFMAIVFVFVCLASAVSVMGQTRTITLDTEVTDTTDGSEDLLWYKYTPEKSGMYTFLSLTTRKAEAYLFTKETQPDGSKLYVQHAYSSSSPNYLEYGQTNSSQFCLTYHLEAGTTYYYAAGWRLASTIDKEMKVKLICEGYDDNLIEKIEATCAANLTWYTDGQWLTDKNGAQYFNYNISRVISNTTVTIYYTDGTTKSATGVYDIDGLTVNYTHDQINNHWYVESDALYTANELTVTVLDKSATINVNIQESELHPIKGKVVDYTTGQPIENANICIQSQTVATTDENGNFAFTSAAGGYTCTITCENSLDNVFPLIVVAEAGANDHTSTPYKLMTGDFVDDEVINVKDIVTVKRSTTMTEAEKTARLAELNSLLSATKDIYKEQA